jgi:anti-sigma B factor antagonist
LHRTHGEERVAPEGLAVARTIRPPKPFVETEEVGPVTVAHLRERRLVGERFVRALGRELTSLLDRAGPATLLLDFAAVEHMSSLIIANLLQLQKQAQAEGGRLALCALRPDLAEVFALTGVDRVLRVFPTEQQALAAL